MTNHLTYCAIALAVLSTANPVMSAEPNVVKDGFLASILKKHPKRLQKTVFLGEPFLCANGHLNILENGDKSGNPLGLKFVSDATNDKWSEIRTKLDQELNVSLSSISERSDVGDRLLVIETSFVVGSTGKISNLKVNELCPGDFHSIILKAIEPVQVSGAFENTNCIQVSGRFVQNYGSKFIEEKERSQVHN